MCLRALVSRPGIVYDVPFTFPPADSLIPRQSPFIYTRALDRSHLVSLHIRQETSISTFLDRSVKLHRPIVSLIVDVVKKFLLLTNIARLAMPEVRLIIARIVRRYDLECVMQDSRIGQPTTYLLWERNPLTVRTINQAHKLNHSE